MKEVLERTILETVAEKLTQMETNSTLPDVSNSTGGKEDESGAQMLDLRGAGSPEEPQALDDIEARDLWFDEEGDDSVFYSDEEQADQDKWGEAQCNLHRVVNSVADEEAQIDSHPGEHRDNPEIEMETTTDDLCASDINNQLVEKLKKIPTEHQQTQGFTALKEKDSDGNESRVNVNQQLKEEPVVQDAETTSTEEDEKEVSEQQGSADLCMPKNREQASQTHTGIHPHPSPPAYSTLPLMRQTGVTNARLQTPCEHLTPSKYSTLSYRKIRKGNTRQKIQDFEYMIMKL